MRRQPGFFDVGERLPELSAKGDDLERTSRLINFEMFRAELERAVPTSDASKGGRPALVESLSELLRVHVRDVTSLGPAVLQRTMQRPDARGYTVVKTRFGSFFIRRSDSDMNVLRQVFTKREYDLDGFPQGKVIRSAYKGFIRRGKVPLIIDAGANAGFASCFFAQVYPDARILAVEPDPANAAICRANTRAIPKIEVIEAALGSRPGHVMLERFKGHSWGTRSLRSETGVPVISIKELKSTVRDSELLIVKVDIEGFELDLFSDNTEWVTEAYAVIVEPHDWLLPGAGSSLTMQRAMLGQERDMLISGENLVWVRRS